ncbi:MAG: FHA domain-containing protein [Bacteroidetes bacterium]|nr:FHA domain-containing protein [Bacteroidota bacterium]
MKLPVPDLAFKFGVPKVTCTKCNKTFKPALAENTEEKTFVLKTLDKEPLGWLVVHDQQAAVQTFDLKSGKHIIGRKSQTRPCDIIIETQDMYMSRQHFIIEVAKNGTSFDFKLADCNSTNHTFLNSQALQENIGTINKGVLLKDGDIIQAGQTKIEFRKRNSNIPNATTATEVVTKKNYAKTVLILK